MRTTAALTAMFAFAMTDIASAAPNPIERLVASHTTTATTYRGRTAEQWASRFRQRTRQLQAARAANKRLVHATSYGGHWLERAFLCIHSHEGSWTDSGAPFWGGLQMDTGFQRSYGGEFYRAFGTANNWPVSVQIAVAIRGYLARGFGPWPNTRRMCGI